MLNGAGSTTGSTTSSMSMEIHAPHMPPVLVPLSKEPVLEKRTRVVDNRDDVTDDSSVGDSSMHESSYIGKQSIGGTSTSFVSDSDNLVEWDPSIAQLLYLK